MRFGLALALAGALATWAPSAGATEVGPQASAPARLLLDVELNHHSLGLLADFQADATGRLSATVGELQSLGFEVTRLTAEQGRVQLDHVPGLTYIYDEAEQRIAIHCSPELLRETALDANQVSESVPLSPTTTGAVLNYDLFANAASPHPLAPTFAAQFDARVFGRFGVVSTSVVATASPQEGLRTTRLDTNWVIESQRYMSTVRLGDSIQSGLAWTRPIRFGGIQISRSFDFRPDLIRTPLPVLRGTAQTPSTLDLYVDGAHRLTTQVPAGPFAVRYAPGVLGAGTSDLIVRDLLGRETRIDLPFYTTDTLLAPRLLDFSFELGFARRDYGLASANYDAHLVGSASVRYGLSSQVTLQMHGEGGAGVINAGGGGVFTIGHLAVASASVAASSSNRGTGFLFDLSLETRRGPFSLSFRSTRTVGQYDDLASVTAVQGDAERSNSLRPAKVTEQAQFSGRLWSPDAVFSLSYARIVRADSSERLASISVTQRIGNASFYLRASQEMYGSRGRSVAIGISLPLGRLYSSSQVVADHGRIAATSEIASQPVVVPGDVAWRARVSEGFVSERSAAVSWMFRGGELEAAAQQTGSGGGVSLRASGAIALVDGALFATRRIDDAFAVVDLGLPNVPISAENRAVGTTDGRGRLLIGGLAAYQPAHIRIDTTRVPVDIDMPVDSFVVAPRRGVAALLTIARAPTSHAALLTLVDGQGQPLLPGGVGELNGRPAAFLVGYDGEAFLEALAEQNLIRIDYGDGRTCVASFPYVSQRERQVRIGPLQCLPLRMATR